MSFRYEKRIKRTMIFLEKNLSDIIVEELTTKKQSVAGLDVGDKVIGVSISDTRIKIASPLLTLYRKNIEHDCKNIVEKLEAYDVGLVVFGWPIQTNGVSGQQCEKTLVFVEQLSKRTNVDLARWDERFSTSVVDKIMVQANMSRKRRKQVVDKIASVYILQGAIDFLNRNMR